jgi:hypothetical protein
LFAGKQAAHIKFGFDKDKFKEIENLKDRLIGDLAENQARFVSDKEKLIQQVMNEKELTQKKNIFLKELDEASTELLFDLKRLNATRSSISEGSRNQGERMSGFTNTMKTEQWKNLYANQSGKIAETNIQISPKDANYIQGEQNLNFIAVKAKHQSSVVLQVATILVDFKTLLTSEATKGDIIRFKLKEAGPQLVL